MENTSVEETWQMATKIPPSASFLPLGSLLLQLFFSIDPEQTGTCSSSLPGHHLRCGVQPLAFPSGIGFRVKAVTDETLRASVGDAVPDRGVGWRVTGFSGPAAMNDDLVATFHNENVFHGVTAADSCSDQL
jgi:hypothetical protein